VAAVTAGPGITNTITALKNAQLAQSPLLLLGGAAPTALQGRGALQDIDQRPLVAPHVKRFFKIRACAIWARPWPSAGAGAQWRARAGVHRMPGGPAVRRGQHPPVVRRGGRQGHGLADRALRWYLQRHVRQMFEGARNHPTGRAGRGTAARPAQAAVRAALAALAKAQRPLAVIGSQAVVKPAKPAAWPRP
jgi:hypothetical protein